MIVFKRLKLIKKESPMQRNNVLDPNTFQFRGLHLDVYMGTASDRYAGWIGQIYSRGRYEGKITSRTRQIGGKPFKTQVLPVESVDEYFDHFRVLEIDYTFYRPLREENGEPTQNYYLLKRYLSYMKEGDTLILKVPQMIFAQKLLQKGQYVDNRSYLNREVFIRQFYEPAKELLGSNLRGFIFEQEYQRKQDRKPVKDLARELEEFFESIPDDDRYHVELRTEFYLSRPIFHVLEKYGVGQVLSHWTWLPSLKKQLARADYKSFNAGKQCIIRLMTPLGVRYENAYAGAQPFDKMVEDMFQPQMVEETADLMHTMIEQGFQANVIINNRAGGNAPTIAQRVAERFLDKK
jgi:uncharacterized protein YecE (DUF72 family)